MASVDGKIKSGLKRRGVKQEVGSKSAPFDKPKPKGCATQILLWSKVAPPAGLCTVNTVVISITLLA